MLRKNNIGLRRVAIDTFPNIKHNYKNTLKLWSDNYMRINESWHLHEPEILSNYRQKLNKIIKHISTQIIKENRTFEQVIKTSNIKYTEFIFNEPFLDDIVLCCLNKLKIYVGFQDDIINAFTINDNKEDDKIINKFLPLLSYNEIRPILISIFIILPQELKNNKNEIEYILNELLPHELKHILDHIYNKIAIQQQSDINELINELEENINYDHIQENVIMGMCQLVTHEEFLWYISECLYYAQETELSAYLETAYTEYKHSAPKQYSLNNSFTYQKYRNFNILTNEIIDDIDYYLFHYGTDIDYLIEKIKPLYKNIKINTFIDLLQYWRKQFMSFLKKAHYVYLKVKEGKTK